MGSFVDRVIAELADDTGAATLKQYFAQLEYTAFWCIRMLRPNENVESVAPEGYEDVLIARPGRYEQRQVKTRIESQGPWTVADVVPILAKQYAKAHIFDRSCSFHFVSNACADTATSFKGDGLGALFKLKVLLDGNRLLPGLTDTEKALFEQYTKRLYPKLLKWINDHGNAGNVTDANFPSFLRHTYIETDSEHLHYPNDTAEYFFRNLRELQDALDMNFPGQPSLTTHDLLGIYLRLLHVIEARIRVGKSLEERKITADNVFQCRVSPLTIKSTPNLSLVPGRTLMEQKARLGGFDDARVQHLYRQHAHALTIKRRFRPDDLSRWEELAVALLDRQITCRERICGAQSPSTAVGPQILEALRAHLEPLVTKYFPSRTDITDQVCLGLLWDETNQCRAYWHHAGGSA